MSDISYVVVHTPFHTESLCCIFWCRSVDVLIWLILLYFNVRVMFHLIMTSQCCSITTRQTAPACPCIPRSRFGPGKIGVSILRAASHPMVIVLIVVCVRGRYTSPYETSPHVREHSDIHMMWVLPLLVGALLLALYVEIPWRTPVMLPDLITTRHTIYVFSYTPACYS